MLRRPSDGATSKPLEFEYYPSKKGKRKRNDSNDTLQDRLYSHILGSQTNGELNKYICRHSYFINNISDQMTFESQQNNTPQSFFHEPSSQDGFFYEILSPQAVKIPMKSMRYDSSSNFGVKEEPIPPVMELLNSSSNSSFPDEDNDDPTFSDLMDIDSDRLILDSTELMKVLSIM